MAFTSRATLRTAVNTWLRRTVTEADLNDLITLFEAKARRNIRAREMESAVNVTVSAQSVALPAGFIALRRFYLATDPVTQMKYMAPDNFWSKHVSSQTGKPLEYTIEGDNFIFGPAPDSSYAGKALIYALTALSDATTPSLFTNHPDYYLYGVLLESEGYYGPNQFHALWEQRHASAENEITRSSAKDRVGGGPLVARPEVVPR